jgi:ATP/maltotriose-dependent transcriptional regulator MalT
LTTLAKLCRPDVRGAVLRLRLFRALDRTAVRPVTWIWGPPGAGKTTLAASYVAARGLRGLWMHLDDGDADVASFFVHLAAAAPRRRRPLPVLSPEYRLALPEFTRRSFRELFGRLPTPFCVVFDDHGNASGGELDEVLAEGLAQVPPGGRVLVTSRARPPPAFARLEAGQALALLDGEALRFTQAESRALLRRMLGRPVAAARLQALQARTEGWAAGLVLLADAGPGAAAGEPGSPVVFDYFAREVLREMPPEQRRALLELALLERPTVALAEAVTGRPEAGRVLAELHRRGYFTSADGRPERAYRLHPLFRDFLLAEARTALSPARRRALRRSAASALERAGAWEEAAGLWRDAGDPGALARLVRTRAPALLAQGRHRTLLDWLAALPDALVDRNPWLGYWRALALQPSDTAACRARLERAFAAFSARRDTEGTCAAWCAGVQTLAHELDDLTLLDAWIDRLARLPPARGRFPSPVVEHRVAHTAILALTLRQPDHPELRGWAARAQRLARAEVEPTQRLEGLCVGITHHLWCGAPGQAVTLARSARELSASKDVAPLLRVLAKMLVARTAWLCAAPTHWRDEAEQGLALAAEYGIEPYRTQLLHECAAILLGGGGGGGGEPARRLLERAAPDPEQLPIDVRSVHFALRAWEALLAGEASAALRAAERACQLTAEAGMPIPVSITEILRAEAWRAAGHRERARLGLARVAESAERTGSALLLWSAELARADAALADGDRPAALAALRRALATGREQGLVSAYGWRPAPMARLCAVALEAGIEPVFARELIARHRLKPPVGLLGREAWPWPIEIDTLGGFEIRREGAAVAGGRKAQRKPLELLQALLVAGRRGMRETELADRLWPDAEGDAARTALGTALHRLRRLLGREDAVRRQHGRLALDPGVCWVDAWDLDGWLDRAAAMQGPDAERALDRALALYAGPFLDDGEDAPWAAPFARRLRGRLARALEERTHWSEERGEAGRALARLERAAELGAADGGTLVRVAKRTVRQRQLDP